MFSLAQMEERIGIFNRAADDLDCQTIGMKSRFADLLRGQAVGMRNCAESLERMVQYELEREAQDAMERGIA